MVAHDRELRNLLTAASMRPGQEAPDGGAGRSCCLVPLCCFNEAGARSPGWLPLPATGATCAASFNEAGARSPGWCGTQSWGKALSNIALQ